MLWRRSVVTIKQTDEAFIVACGLSGDVEAGRKALDLRRRLAEFGKVQQDSLTATTKIIDTGLIHPADSIDLIEFTVHMEDIVGKELDASDIQQMVDAGAEEMEIRKWVQIVLEIPSQQGIIQKT